MKQGTKEYRSANIKEMQGWPLDKKITHSLKRIKEFYEAMDGKVYIAFSGGKDSGVLKHLVHSLYPDIPTVFSNTTNELPEIIEHVKSTDDVIWLTPKMTFVDTIKKYGFPLVGKMVARKVYTLRHPTPNNENTVRLYSTGINQNGEYHANSKLSEKWKFLLDEPFEITNVCCDILKKEPMKRYETETGRVPFIGTQAIESETRKKNWIDHGCNIIDSKKPSGRPLSIWSDKDIWEYTHRFEVPYSSAYADKLDDDENVIVKGEVRTGCAYCGFGADQEKSDLVNLNRFERLKLRKPKQYEKMMNIKNNGITFREALHKVGVRA